MKTMANAPSEYRPPAVSNVAVGNSAAGRRSAALRMTISAMSRIRFVILGA
jgi:hypothetical protein